MIRETTKIILELMILAGRQNVFSDTAVFSESTSKVDLTRTDTVTPIYGNGKKSGGAQQNISDVFALLREATFHDASPRFVAARVSPAVHSQASVATDNTVNTDPNLNGMLVLGLGIALISVVRRLERS